MIDRERFASILDAEISDWTLLGGDARLLMVGRGIDPSLLDAVQATAGKLAGAYDPPALASAMFAIGLACGLKLAPIAQSERLERIEDAARGLPWDEICVCGADRTVGEEEAAEVAAIYAKLYELRESLSRSESGG